MIKRKQVADFTGDFDIKIQAKSSDQETEANLITQSMLKLWSDEKLTLQNSKETL